MHAPGKFSTITTALAVALALSASACGKKSKKAASTGSGAHRIGKADRRGNGLILFGRDFIADSGAGMQRSCGRRVGVDRHAGHQRSLADAGGDLVHPLGDTDRRAALIGRPAQSDGVMRRVDDDHRGFGYRGHHLLGGDALGFSLAAVMMGAWLPSLHDTLVDPTALP